MKALTPTVHILLPTFNGARYVRQQLDSLMAQDYPEIAVHIRDDGSTDATPEILKEYQRTGRRVDLTFGENVGLFRSLHILLDREVGPNDFIALCDQDDVWRQDKVSAAVDLLLQQENPGSALYVSRLQFVDEHLEFLALPKPRRRIGFFNAVVESSFSGCTMVFGDAIRKLVLISKPSDWIMHDWWIYLVASSIGNIVYDMQPRMLYRRHTANTSEWTPSLVERIRDRVKEFVERYRAGRVGFSSLRQAERFLDTYRDLLSEEQVKIVAELVDMRKEGMGLRRLRYALSPTVRREAWVDDVAMRLMIMLKQH